MKAKVKMQLLKTTTFDSGALGMLAMVIHLFSSAGHYRVVILEQGRPVSDVDFEVDEQSEVMQLDIDVAQAVRNTRARPEDCRCQSKIQASRVVSSKGYVLFHASSGYGYSVIVSGGTGDVVFNSTRLGDGDLFAVSLLEPATYAMTNNVGSATGEIVVSLTREVASQLRTLETRYIDVSEEGFDPERMELMSSQGLVFRIKGSARILIEKKDAPSARDRKPMIRWQKLQPIRE